MSTLQDKSKNELIEEIESLKKDVRDLEKNKELEQINDLFVGREFRIKELKDKVKELEKGKNEKGKN